MLIQIYDMIWKDINRMLAPSAFISNFPYYLHFNNKKVMFLMIKNINILLKSNININYRYFDQ